MKFYTKNEIYYLVYNGITHGFGLYETRQAFMIDILKSKGMRQ